MSCFSWASALVRTRSTSSGIGPSKPELFRKWVFRILFWIPCVTLGVFFLLILVGGIHACLTEDSEHPSGIVNLTPTYLDYSESKDKKAEGRHAFLGRIAPR